MTDHDLANILWEYMRFEQPLEKADALIGLGSTDLRTAEWCTKLFHDRWAPRIVFSGARGRISRNVFTENEADVFHDIAVKNDVPEDAILLERKALNTGDNIALSAKLLAKSHINVDKIIVVTKPYMLRRAYATFMKQWPGKKPEVICSAIDLSFDEYCKHPLYRAEYVTEVMVGDLQRIKEYPKLGFQIEQKIPDEVWQAYKELLRRDYTGHLIKT